MKSLFRHACLRCAVLVDGSQVELVFDGDTGEHFLTYKPREETAPELIELTPRVRLGLWLAEDCNRVWDARSGVSQHRVELDGGTAASFYQGAGPTLDAAIEDALAKLPKETP